MENPQIQGQRERGFGIGVKEEEKKHRLWGQNGLSAPTPNPTKPRLKGERREQGLCYSQFKDTVSPGGFRERKE